MSGSQCECCLNQHTYEKVHCQITRQLVHYENLPIQSTDIFFSDIKIINFIRNFEIFTFVLKT